MVNVDMTFEQGLAELRWSHIVLLTLQQESSGFPKLNNKVLRMELLIVLLKSLGYLTQISLLYPGSWLNLQTRFIFWNHYAVNINIKYGVKIFFIEYRYFGLNTDTFYWMQIYFYIYNIFLIEYKYFFIEWKYFFRIQIYFLKYQIFFIEYKYFFLNTNIFCWISVYFLK